ncbi:MAG: nickel-responsive transcriptional regulator NikR [Candidatus Thermoplasmatota archaeon]|nr:nickel-responsive transcriptional regulator NikR [Candidatus Thermoplasmatota archaeon]
MEKVVRFGVSIEEKLLKVFDKLIKKKGYSSRSEAIRDLIRDKTVKQILENENETVVGTLTIVYDHDASNVTNKLLDAQHRHHKNVLSTMHVHLDEHSCLEVLVVSGKVKDVQSIADSITSIKGVKHGKLTVTKKRFD